MITCNVSKNRVSISGRELLTSGTVAATQCRFVFDRAWDGLQKAAVFTNGEKTITVEQQLWDNDTYAIPHEVLATQGRTVRVGFYGSRVVGGTTQIVIPTIWAELGQTEVGVQPSEVYPADKAPTLADKILRYAERAETAQGQAQQSTIAAEKAKQSAKDYSGTAQEAADRAEAAAIRQPLVGSNGNWWVWDPSRDMYADSGKPARGPRGPQGYAGVFWCLYGETPFNDISTALNEGLLPVLEYGESDADVAVLCYVSTQTFEFVGAISGQTQTIYRCSDPDITQENEWSMHTESCGKVSSVNGQNPDTDGNVYLDSSVIPNSNFPYCEFLSDAIDFIYSEATSKMPLPFIKNIMAATPRDNTIYYLGLQTAINFELPSSPSLNEHFRVVFYSGMTKTTISITGDYYGEIVPYMNHRVSCDFVYDGTAWSVVTIQIPTYIVYGFCGEPSVNASKDVMWGRTENNDLVIYGDGAMASNYASSANQPWAQYQQTIRTITVDAGVTTIGKEAFKNIKNATSVSLVDGLTSIGANAFYECNSLSSVIIPNSVTSLGASSFYNCSSLSNLQISESITAIPDWIFAGCRNLTSISIPQGVTRLGGHSFQNCLGLTSIRIPNSVNTIGTSAFASTNSLHNVYYNGTKAQWQAISVSTGNEQLSLATIHCTDGNITPV